MPFEIKFPFKQFIFLLAVGVITNRTEDLFQVGDNTDLRQKLKKNQSTLHKIISGQSDKTLPSPISINPFAVCPLQLEAKKRIAQSLVKIEIDGEFLDRAIFKKAR